MANTFYKEEQSMKKVLLVILMLLLLPAIALAGGKNRGEPEPEETEMEEAAMAEEPLKELRVTFAWPTYIDPAVGSDFSSSSSFVNLYDTLVYPTPDGGVKPNVAERWETSDDGLTWTFYLRKGVKFHDGSELTAQDVAFTMDRITRIGEGYGYMFIGKVQDTEAVDDYTVRFTLSEPYGPFLITLVRLYILNEDLVMANIKADGTYGDMGDYAKEWLLTHDAGSGPYQVNEVRLEEYVLMDKFDDYWGYFAQSAPESVKFIGTTEAVTVRTMMSRKELEIGDQWQSVEALNSLDALEGVDIATMSYGTMFSFMMHTGKPPTDDIHFRRALAYALDYQTVVDKIFPGAILAQGPVSPGYPGHWAGFPTSTRDLDRAMTELKQSKYYDRLDEYPVEIHWIAEVPDEEKVALLALSNFSDIGVETNVVKVPWLSVVEEMGNKEQSPNIVTVFVAPHYPEAGSMLSSRYHSSSAPTWEQNEWLLDPEIDAMIDEAIATIDMKERYGKYEEIQKVINDLQPSLHLFEQAQKHPYQASYVDWPATTGNKIPVMGYDFAANLISVYPERK
jgi:peptide/nickel transport system substrate-binding protein